MSVNPAPPRRVVVNSIVRRATHRQASGFIRVVDLDSGKTLSKWSVPASEFLHLENNPRGGLRGARGLASWGDFFVVANTERLFVYDPGWRRVGVISHPWMGAVHDILADSRGIWVTCTGADLLLQISWSGQVLHSWSWREDRQLMQRLGYRRLQPFDPQVDYRLPGHKLAGVANSIHLNSIARHRDTLLLSFGRILQPSYHLRRRIRDRIVRPIRRLNPHRGNSRMRPKKGLGPTPASAIQGCTHAIVSLDSEGRADLLYRQENVRVPNHNIARVGNLVVFNDSNAGELVAAPVSGAAPELRIPIPGKPGFVRGLARIGERQFLVGNQNPAAIYEVDLDRGSVLRRIDLHGEPAESVYAICPLPDHFETPESIA